MDLTLECIDAMPNQNHTLVSRNQFPSTIYNLIFVIIYLLHSKDGKKPISFLPHHPTQPPPASFPFHIVVINVHAIDPTQTIDVDVQMLQMG